MDARYIVATTRAYCQPTLTVKDGRIKRVVVAAPMYLKVWNGDVPVKPGDTVVVDADSAEPTVHPKRHILPTSTVNLMEWLKGRMPK